MTNDYNSLHRQDGHWQQLRTTNVLVNATHWLSRPCSIPLWIDRVSKKPAIKADLAILECSFNDKDFDSCAIWIGFANSVTNKQRYLTETLSLSLQGLSAVYVKSFKGEKFVVTYGTAQLQLDTCF